MRKSIVVCMMFLCLAGICGAQNVNINQALIIDSSPNTGNVASSGRFTDLSGLLRESNFNVKNPSASSESEVESQIKLFLDKVEQGLYVFIYIRGRGSYQESTGENKAQHMLITSQGSKYDLQKLFSRLNEMARKQLIKPLVVLDMVYEQGNLSSGESPGELTIIPEVFTVFSQQAGIVVQNADADIFIQKIGEVSQEIRNPKTQMSVNEFFERVQRRVSSTTKYKQKPQITGFSSLVFNVGGGLPPVSCWDKVRNGAKAEPVAVGLTGAGIVGGLIYLVSQLFESEPKRLPNPPAPPRP